MKRTNFILNGFLALATVLVFAQCTAKTTMLLLLLMLLPLRVLPVLPT